MENYSISSGTLEIVRKNCDSEEYFRNYPPGWYFKPTDEELILEYLNKKVNDQPLPINLIHEVNIYKYHPHDLCEKYELIRADAWYFFTPRDKKYPNGSRPNRAAGGNGVWKATGADVTIMMKGNIIGRKATLKYFGGTKGDDNGNKVDWIMHEFRLAHNSIRKGNNLQPNGMMLDRWVLSRIYKKPSSKSGNSGGILQDSQSQKAGEILSIASFDVYQDYPKEPSLQSSMSQPPQVMAFDWHDPMLDAHYLHQVMSIDWHDHMLAEPHDYPCLPPAVAPPGLPSFPPTEDLGWSLKDYSEPDPLGLLGHYNYPTHHLGFRDSSFLFETGVAICGSPSQAQWTLSEEDVSAKIGNPNHLSSCC